MELLPDELGNVVVEVLLEQGDLGDVFFDFDQYELRADARDRLAKNAQWLAAHPEFTLTLEGHCDERGTNEYNLALGDRRAAAAREYLQSLGVAANLIRRLNDATGATSLVVSHDVHECFLISDYVYVISAGRIVGRGTPAEVEASDDPEVRQFIRGEPDGPVKFHYPAAAYGADLGLRQ